MIFFHINCSRFLFDNEVVEYLCNQSKIYASSRNKNNFSFDIDIDEMRAFITILLIIVYNSLTKKRMWWEQESDVLNCAISVLMSQNQFDEVLRFLYLTDNYNLQEKTSWRKCDHFMIRWIFYKHSEWKKTFMSTNWSFHITARIQPNNISRENLSNFGIRYGASIHPKDTLHNAILMPVKETTILNHDFGDQ